MNKPNLACAGAHGCSSGNTEVDAVLNKTAADFNAARRVGARIGPDGHSVLTPVKGGDQGLFLDPNEYLSVHDLDCNKESNALVEIGDFVGGISSAVTGGAAPLVYDFLSRKVKERRGTKRYYSCADAKEFAGIYNARVLEGKMEELEKECAAKRGIFNPSGSCTLGAEPQPQEGVTPLAPQIESRDMVSVAQATAPAQGGISIEQRAENMCAAQYKECPAGGEWGPTRSDSGQWRCECR